MARGWWLLLALAGVAGLAAGGRQVKLSVEASKNRAAFLPLIAQVERDNGIPAGMLDRLLYQESRYRTDIITGRVRSPVGAVGIAQFMPATAAELGVNPLDPRASIVAAGRYLRQVYGWVGNDWAKAAAGYNWGAGNVRKAVKAHGPGWLARAPKETRDYVAAVARVA